MTDKTVLITGATGGIGKQTAIGLACLGAQVIISGRNRESAESARQEIVSAAGHDRVHYLLSDLSTVAGVRQLAADFQRQFGRLDVLINNAGSACPEYRLTADGLETNFAVNVLSPYLLSVLLLENLKASADGRIITLAGGDLPATLDLGNLQSEKGFFGLNTYSQTKIAMMCLMYEFAGRINAAGVSCNICYPGQAGTAMTQQVTADMLPWMMRPIFPLFRFFVRPDGGKSAKKASRSSVFLASSPEMAGKTGIYVDKNVQIKPMPKAVMNEANRAFVWDYVHRLPIDSPTPAVWPRK